MNTTRYGLLATITAFSACGTLLSPIVAQGQEAVSQDTEVLTRGPVHEAFAETVSFEPEAGALISTQPPEAIDELPPEQELEGDNVTWIAGYWSWDEDLNDFMWVSGVWRNVPPDREWVPGYWNEVGAQWQWVSGYWADAGTEEVSYLPEPPRSLERGPNIAATSDNDVWIPGSWTYVDTRYRWRPGYYQPYRRDWTYVPDRYSWTPRGYVYVAGYWDYPIETRGIIFAPVRFHGPVWRQPNYHYSPVTVINIGLVVNHLFVRPSYGHYYFGDYYEPRYRDRGFYSSVTYATTFRTRGFDPIFAHERWEHRDDRDWEHRRMNDFEYFRDNRDARPPQNFAALRDLGNGRRGFKGRDGGELAVATPLATFAKAPEGGKKFKQLNEATREKFVEQRQAMTKFSKQRQQIEKEGPRVAARGEGQGADKGAEQAEAAVKPAKVKIPRSPVVGRKAAQMSQDQAPPKRKQAPAVLDKDPTDTTPGADKEADQNPQPGRPGRGKGGRGQGGKGDMTDGDKGKPDGDNTPAKPDKGPNEPKVKPTPEREPKVKPQPEREPKVKPEQPEREPKVKPEQPEREPRVKPQQPEREPKVKPEQPEREPRVKPEQPEREPKVKPEPQPKREREVQPKPEREVQPKPEPKREAQPQPQREREVQPKREAQPQPQREREVQPKREAQPQPQREREVQPKREAQPQPQREKAQPKPQQERQVQPQRERQQPQRQPEGGGGGGGGKGKGKDKDKAAE
ncbi:YXWGXW repeat-containing protein [Haloferula sp. BvORR071]|uniref:YXWGXW repeat-containing protein n=1 Tax=Haloferula sp. BvORR071 TaxID=1396141 RepID=UPI000695B310|nr:YXWGXW repeat-containing protein [Haloferula sp. BvORR071]